MQVAILGRAPPPHPVGMLLLNGCKIKGHKIKGQVFQYHIPADTPLNELWNRVACPHPPYSSAPVQAPNAHPTHQRTNAQGNRVTTTASSQVNAWSLGSGLPSCIASP